MKMKQLIVLKIFACVMLMTAHEAQAFYNPSAGRWLSRDPIGDTAFLLSMLHEKTGKQRMEMHPRENTLYDFISSFAASESEKGNLYRFSKNMATSTIDPLGLKCGVK